uniref:Uncharacterized protein n=1 Tax=Macrostomum lignano TaxID=282301 RepID=A0A1I8FGX1_9PLAT
DLNKALDVVFTRRPWRGLHGQQGRLDEATGRRHSRHSARHARAGPSWRKCRKCGPTRCGVVVNTLDGAIQSLDDMEVCASSLELIGASHKSTTFREALRGPQRGPGCCIRAPTRQGLRGQQGRLLTDLSEAATSACPPGFSKNLSSTVCTFIRQEPQVTFCESESPVRSAWRRARHRLRRHFGASQLHAAPLDWRRRPRRRARHRQDRLAARQRARGNLAVANSVWRSGRPNNLGDNQDCLLVKEATDWTMWTATDVGWHCVSGASPDPSARVGAGMPAPSGWLAPPPVLVAGRRTTRLTTTAASRVPPALISQKAVCGGLRVPGLH